MMGNGRPVWSNIWSSFSFLFIKKFLFEKNYNFHQIRMRAPFFFVSIEDKKGNTRNGGFYFFQKSPSHSLNWFIQSYLFRYLFLVQVVALNKIISYAQRIRLPTTEVHQSRYLMSADVFDGTPDRIWSGQGWPVSAPPPLRFLNRIFIWQNGHGIESRAETTYIASWLCVYLIR